MQQAGVARTVETSARTAAGSPRAAVAPVDSTNPGTESTLRWKFPACSGLPQMDS